MRIDSSSVSGSTYSGGAGTNVSAQNDSVIRSIKKQIKDANKKCRSWHQITVSSRKRK